MISTTPKLIKFFTIIIFLIIFCSIILASRNCLAWSGFDYENKTSIEIPVGNLVREGSVIQFYETKSDNYRTAKIIFMQSVALGTEIELLDLDSKKNRVFIMNN